MTDPEMPTLRTGVEIMKLTDGQYVEASRQTALAMVEGLLLGGVPPSDVADVIGAAALEALGQTLGSLAAAIERLRSLADVAEAQLLAGDSLPG